jgi:hypothetical protein
MARTYLLVKLDHTFADGRRDSFELGMCVKLVEDALHVIPYGVETDVQLLGHSLVRGASCHELKHLQLPRPEVRAETPASRNKLRGEVARPDDGRGPFAFVDGADGLDQ